MFSLEHAQGLAEAIGRSWILTGDPSSFLHDVDEIEKVSAADVAARRQAVHDAGPRDGRRDPAARRLAAARAKPRSGRTAPAAPADRVRSEALLAARVALAVAACGPKPTPVEVPLLPTDGTAHTAKPSRLRPKPQERRSVDRPHRPDHRAAGGRTGARRAAAGRGLQARRTGSRSTSSRTIGCRSSASQLAIRAGRQQEPRARLGVSEATADMLVKGTKKHDAVGAREGDRLRRRHDRRRRDVRGHAGVVQRAGAQQEHVPRSRARDDHAVDVSRRRARRRSKSRWSRTCAPRLDDADQLAAVHVQNLLWGNEHVRGWINSEQLGQRDPARRARQLARRPGSCRTTRSSSSSGDVDPQDAQGRARARVRRLEEGRSAAGRRRTRSPGSRASGSGSSTSRARRRPTSGSRSSASSTTTRGSSTRWCGTTCSAAVRSARA